MKRKIAAELDASGATNWQFDGEGGPTWVTFHGHVYTLDPVAHQTLKVLDLSASRVADDQLPSIRHLPKLRTVRLDNTDISDIGLRHLATLDSLNVLSLHATAVTDDVIDSLANLPQLRLLDISDTRITSDGIRVLQSLRPNLDIIHNALPANTAPEPSDATKSSS